MIDAARITSYAAVPSLIGRAGGQLELDQNPLRLGPLRNSLNLADGRLHVIAVVRLQRVGNVSDGKHDVSAAELADRTSAAAEDRVGRGVPAARVGLDGVGVRTAADGVAGVAPGVQGPLLDVVEDEVDGLEVVEAVQEVGDQPELAGDVVVVLVFVASALAADHVDLGRPEDAVVDDAHLESDMADALEVGVVEDEHPVGRRRDVLRLASLLRLPVELEVHEVGGGVDGYVDVVVSRDLQRADEGELHGASGEWEGGGQLGPFVVSRAHALGEVTAVGRVDLCDLVAGFSQLDLPQTLLVIVGRATLQRHLDNKEMKARFLHSFRPDHCLDLGWHRMKAIGDGGL